MEAASVVEVLPDHRAVTTAEVVAASSISMVVAVAAAVYEQRAGCEARVWLSRNNTTATEGLF
jgi:hypothetical protein